MPSCHVSRRRRCQADIGLRPSLQRHRQSLSFSMWLLLLLGLLLLALLARCRGDVLECYGAFDVLAGEDGLVAPADEDPDVAGYVGRHYVEQSRRGLTDNTESPSAREGNMQSTRQWQTRHRGRRYRNGEVLSRDDGQGCWDQIDGSR